MNPDETAWKEEVDLTVDQHPSLQAGPEVTLRVPDEHVELVAVDRPENLPKPAKRNVSPEAEPCKDGRSREDAEAPGTVNWSGTAAYLWRRALAAAIDACVMGVVDIFIFFGAFWLMSGASGHYDSGIVLLVNRFMQRVVTSPEGQMFMVYAFMLSASCYIFPILMPIFWFVLLGKAEVLFNTPLIVAMLAVCLANAYYSVLQEGSGRRATIGQRLMGLGVCTAEGNAVPVGKLILRNLCAGLCLPFTLFDAVLGFPSASQGQSFSDLLVRTRCLQGRGAENEFVALTGNQSASIRITTIVLTTAVLSMFVYGVRTFHAPTLPVKDQQPVPSKPQPRPPRVFNDTVLRNGLQMIDQPGANVSAIAPYCIQQCLKNIQIMSAQRTDPEAASKYWDYCHRFLTRLSSVKSERQMVLAFYRQALQLANSVKPPYRPPSGLYNQMTQELSQIAQ
ncbi:MAG TPA: RDD family protein [Planktothrix sp.]|jgi:uncharacterized RDD family membrane protein YckC